MSTRRNKAAGVAAIRSTQAKLHTRRRRNQTRVDSVSVPEDVAKNAARTRRSHRKDSKLDRRKSLSPTPSQRMHPHASTAKGRRQLIVPSFVLPSISLHERLHKYNEFAPSKSSTAAIVRRIKEVGKLACQETLLLKAKEAKEVGSCEAEDLRPRKNPLRLTGELAWSLTEANQANDIIDEISKDLVIETLADLIKGGSNSVLAAAYNLVWNRPHLQREEEKEPNVPFNSKIKRRQDHLAAVFRSPFLRIHGEIARVATGSTDV